LAKGDGKSIPYPEPRPDSAALIILPAWYPLIPSILARLFHPKGNHFIFDIYLKIAKHYYCNNVTYVFGKPAIHRLMVS
jgi:hypothetical protein